jgi:hypothetical protein
MQYKASILIAALAFAGLSAPASADFLVTANGGFTDFATAELGGPTPGRVPTILVDFVISRVEPVLAGFEIIWFSSNLDKTTKVVAKIEIVRDGVRVANFKAKTSARPPTGNARRVVNFPAGYEPQVGDVVMATFKAKGAGSKIVSPEPFSGGARIFLSADALQLP